jgi:hypothetical protein
MRSRRLIAALALFTQLAACTKWQLQEMAPEQLLIEEQPEHIVVTRTDGKWLFLQDPRIANDSLVGIDFYHVGRAVRGVPLSQVQHVQVRKTDWLKTGLVIGLPIAFFVALATSMPQ